MPYIKEVCNCGNVIEIRKYFSTRYKKSGIRKKNVSPTPEDVQRNNLKYAKMKLRRLLNANFKKGDLHIQLLYKTSEQPKDEAEAEKILVNFLKRVRYAMNKDGLPFKFVWSTERGKVRGKIHHHIVVEAKALEYILKKWRSGRVQISRIYTDNLSELADYMLKSFERKEMHGKNRYHKSTNLIIPKVTKQIVKADSWREAPTAPKGFYLEKDSFSEGICELTGYPYQNYTLIRIE